MNSLFQRLTRLWHQRAVRQTIQVLWVFGVFGFIGLAIATNWEAISRVAWNDTAVLLIVAALAASLLRRLAGGLRWAWVVNLFKTQGDPMPLRDSLRVYFITNLGTYLPGTYWFIPARMMMNSKHGMTAMQTGISTVFEQVLLVLSGALLGLLGLELVAEVLGVAVASFWWIAVVVVLGLVSIHPISLRFIMTLLARALRKPLGEYNLKYSTTLLHLVWSIVIWLLGSLALLLLAMVFVSTLTFMDLPVFSAIFAVSWLIGFFTPFAPSGIGIREGVMGLAFGVMGFPVGAGVVIAMLSRLLIVAEDLFWAGFSVVFLKEAQVGDAAYQSATEHSNP